jgi:chaperone required for assembly of F1-ATPase
MKKIYTSVACEKQANGFAVLLDATIARTPLGNPLMLPNEALAEAVAAEWRAQLPMPDKTALRLTPIACIAIDLAPTRRAALSEELIGYGDTDLVCYRAGNIPELEAEQEALLAPVVAWAKDTYGLQLQITSGLMPVKQPKQNAAIYADMLARLDNWHLAVLAVAAKALGSLLLACLLLEGAIDAEEAFALSHLEEAYETRKWGPDDEKEAKMKLSRREIEAAAAFIRLLK